MKFFIIILISSFLTAHSVYLDSAQDTPEPSRQLYCLYSTLHNLSPRSVDPSISSLILETPIEDDASSVLLVSLPIHLCSAREGIQHACVRDLYSRLLSVPARSLNCISVLSNLCIFAEYRLLEHDNHIGLPKLYGDSRNLQYVNSFYTQPYCKTMNFYRN